MKSTFFVLACAALAALFNQGSAVSCSGMENKEMYESVLGVEMKGCAMTAKEAMVAADRMNWMIPSGEHTVEMTGVAEEVAAMEGMTSKKDMQMMKMGLKVATVATSQSGTLKMNPECLTTMPPDMVAMMLVEADSPKVFNRMVKEACAKTTTRLLVTERVSGETTVEQVTLLSCVLSIILSFLLPGLTAPLLAVLKAVTTSIIVMIPCPSGTGRIVTDVFA